MPLFEYVCSQCGNQFEVLVRNTAASSAITCPACQSIEVKKKISTFASKVSGGNPSFSLGSSAAACSTGST